MIEIELKYQITAEKLEELKEQILSLGFTIAFARVYEKNVLYDNPQNLMQISDGRIRLRQTGDKTEFCYKKPIKDDSGIKKEIEHQVNTSSFAITETILKMIEFKPNYAYERFRTKYTNGEVEIVLDEFPFANFVEIEGAEDKILAVGERLGLDFKDNINDSCDNLFASWRKEQGLEPTNMMTFDTFD